MWWHLQGTEDIGLAGGVRRFDRGREGERVLGGWGTLYPLLSCLPQPGRLPLGIPGQLSGLPEPAFPSLGSGNYLFSSMK